MQYKKNLKKSKKNKNDLNKSLKNYSRYSGLAFQMAAVIFLGTWGGYKADAFFNFENHILTLIFSVLSVIIAIYIAVKDFIK
ncbi:MAG: AtpZ/AtpI family protein [Chlorobi bacterium]|nr:AtpZ/AtpI family protein [Chlorobiota bacterium]